MENALISIIIPVFNSELLIKKCLQSIINQSYKNIEIIIVDDGSTDESSIIYREFKKNDNRIKVIYKENGGVSSARNEGIKISKGEYIQFVDSDDYLDLDMCENLVKAIDNENIDMIICGYNIIANKKIKKIPCMDILVKNNEVLGEIFSDVYMQGLINSPWNKLYRKSKIKYYFDDNLSLAEDLIFNINNMSNMNEIKLINYCMYNYMKDCSRGNIFKYKVDRFRVAEYVYLNVKIFLNNKNINTEKLWGVDTAFINDVIAACQNVIYNKEFSKAKKISFINQCITNKNVVYANNQYRYYNVKFNIISKLIKTKSANLIYIIMKLNTIKSILYLNL